MTLKKNWMIRTKDFYLLGPVSKKKIIELLQNDSLRQTDEVCSGNGFWFSISEKPMVQLYIMEANSQGFNPISEAKTVIEKELNTDDDVDKTVESELGTEAEIESEKIVIPKEEDLAYPSEDEITQLKESLLNEIRGNVNKENAEEAPPIPSSIPDEVSPGDFTIVKPQLLSKKEDDKKKGNN